MSTGYSHTKGNKSYQDPAIMPHDTDTERTVLATLIRHNELWPMVSDMLSADMFYYDKERSIFKTIEGVLEGGGITDINALAAWASIHDTGFNLERQDFVVIMQLQSVATVRQDIERLRDMARRRTYWTLMQQAAQNMLDLTTDIDESLEGAMTALTDISSNDKEGIYTFRDALDELSDIVQGNASGKRTALPTGYYVFDNYYLLRPGTLTVIAAFTSVGKSALAMNIATNVAERGYAVAYYSLEMGKAELAARAVSKKVGATASEILNEHLSASSMSEYYAVKEHAAKLPIYIDERSTVSFDRTVRSIRKMAKTCNVKLVVIDYLQIYTQTSDNVEASLAQMARQAKNVAKETSVAVIMLSQLNRSGLHPSINMMRGSGQIEESADNIVLIDRPEAYPDNKVTSYEGEFNTDTIKGTAKLILAKGRGVGTGCDLLTFDGMHTTFSDRHHPKTEPSKSADEDLPF